MDGAEQAIERAAVAGGGGGARGAAEELWSRRGERAPGLLPRVAALGEEAAQAGDGVGDAVRRVVAIGVALDAKGDERWWALVGEAAALAAEAHERARGERREAWLAYFSHELKNSLNTVLNAVWLLRELRGGPAGERFIALAEKAVRKLEGGIGAVRELERRLGEMPPVPLRGR